MATFKRLYVKFTSFESALFRYSLAFGLLLTLAPALIIFVLIFSYTALDINILTTVLARFLPTDLVEPFIVFLTNKTYSSWFSTVWTLVVSLWLASRSFNALLLISAREEGIVVPKYAIRLKAIGMFLLVVISVAIGITLASIFQEAVAIFMLAFFFLGLAWLYRGFSFIKRPMAFGYLGSAIATMGIVGTGLLLFSIISRFFSYESIYGPLASLIILLLSVWIIASILYFGFLVNIVFYSEDVEHENKKIKSSWFFNGRFAASLWERIGPKN